MSLHVPQGLSLDQSVRQGVLEAENVAVVVAEEYSKSLYSPHLPTASITDHFIQFKANSKVADRALGDSA